MASIKPNIRRRIYVRDGYKCLKCKCTDYFQLTIDHIVPLSEGGKNIPSNMQTLCQVCNQYKGNQTIDYRTILYPGERPIRTRIPKRKDLKTPFKVTQMTQTQSVVTSAKILHGNPGDTLVVQFTIKP